MPPFVTIEQEEIRCRPCRRTFPLVEMANPRRCPVCGGPTVNDVQMREYRAATAESLQSLKARATYIMRITSLSMVGVQVLTYFMDDATAASFFDHATTGAAGAAALATEAWQFTGTRATFVAASLCLQIAAILFFYVAIGVLSLIINGRVAFLIGCLPLAASLAAWHQYRAWSQLQRMSQKKG